MHLLIVAIYVVIILLFLRRFSFLPYALMILYVIGCASSVLGFDASFMTILGITITAGDCLMIFCLFHYLRSGKIHVQHNIGYVALWLYFVLFLVNLARGFIDSFNAATLIANVRKYFLYVVPWIVCATEDMGIQKEKFKRSIEIGIDLTLIFCAVGWGLYFVGVKGDLRVIHSDSAMILSIYTMCRLYEEIVDQKKIPSVKTYLCIGAILLLQHNSVWAATAVGVLVILFVDYRKNGFNKVMAIVGVILLLFVGIIIRLEKYNGDNLVFRSMMNSLDKFNSMDSGTIGHRKERWGLLLDSLKGVENIIGQNFSIGTNVGGMNFSAHNAYIAAIMHSGYFGGGLFIVALLYLTLKSVREKEYIFAAIIVSLMTYWYAYEPDINFGVILGFIMYKVNWKALNTIPTSSMD